MSALPFYMNIMLLIFSFWWAALALHGNRRENNNVSYVRFHLSYRVFICLISNCLLTFMLNDGLL